MTAVLTAAAIVFTGKGASAGVASRASDLEAAFDTMAGGKDGVQAPCAFLRRSLRRGE
jgi:hypothetical protein